MRVDNAIILAAGFASRFAPLSYEKPKALLEVRGEILIERQIRQLREVGISDIIVVVGYKSEQFKYLERDFGVILVNNSEYATRNNSSSIYAAREYLKNTYICSSDNYFSENPFKLYNEEAYYTAVYSETNTPEWCMTEGADGYIDSVTIGGQNSWYMLGPAFWDERFSEEFIRILEQVYLDPETKGMLWEDIFINNLPALKMRIKKFSNDIIFEFDTFEELREFDDSYKQNTRSEIIRNMCARYGLIEKKINNIEGLNNINNIMRGFAFDYDRKRCFYDCDKQLLMNENDIRVTKR